MEMAEGNSQMILDGRFQNISSPMREAKDQNHSDPAPGQNSPLHTQCPILLSTEVEAPKIYIHLNDD